MNLNKPSQKLGASGLALGAALLLAQLTCEVVIAQQQEQQQSQSQQQPPSPPPSTTPPPSSQPASDPVPPIGALPVKRRKVWTNDEVVVLRTPADSYQVEKEAKQAADAEAAAKEARQKAAGKTEKESSLDIKLPATPEETKMMLKSALDDIQEETVIVNKLQKDLLDAPAGQQAEKQKEIDRLSASLETLRRNVKALQDHLLTFPEKPQGENPPAAPQPPPA
jgi:hypothetical protein